MLPHRAPALLAALTVLSLAVPWSHAADPVPTPEARAAARYAACIAQWNPWHSAGGIWTGDLTTTTTRRGDPSFRRIQMHLKFTAATVRVSIRRPGRPWRLVGTDTGGAQARRADELFIAVADPGPGDRPGHAIILTRLNDALAEVTYTRTALRPRAGQAVAAETEPLLSGIVARSGTAVPEGWKTLGSTCGRRPPEKPR